MKYLLITLTAVIITLTLPTPSQAAYETAMNTIDNLEIKHQSGSTHDMTEAVYSKSTIRNFMEANPACTEDFKTDFFNGYDNGSKAIVQKYRNYFGTKSVYIMVHIQPEQSLQWADTYIQAPVTHLVEIISDDYQNALALCDTFQNPTQIAVSTSWGDEKLFASTYSPNLPQDYTGTEPPLIGGKPEGYTKFNYYVNDKNVKLENQTILIEGLDDQCIWRVNTNPAETYDEGDVLNDQVISRSCTEKPTYIFAQYGHYEVSLSVHYPRGLDGMSESDTWDAYKTLAIDGSTFSGAGNIHGDAVLDNPTQETCSLTDLGCHLRNLLVNLSLLISSIFTPNTSNLRIAVSNFYMNFLESFGFLAYPVDVIRRLLMSMVDVANAQQIVCDVNVGTMMSNPVNLNFCVLEQNFPQLWAIVQTLIAAITTFALIIGIRNKWQQVLTA